MAGSQGFLSSSEPFGWPKGSPTYLEQIEILEYFKWNSVSDMKEPRSRGGKHCNYMYIKRRRERKERQRQADKHIDCLPVLKVQAKHEFILDID